MSIIYRKKNKTNYLLIKVTVEWLASGNGELHAPSSSPSPASAEFSVIADWVKDTQMLPINPSQSRADFCIDGHRRAA